MANAAINVYHDQFINLANGSTATMLVLPISLGLTKGATLTINEVDSSGVPSGLYGTGVVAAIASGEFYNLPDGYNQYYLNPLNMFTWIDYSSVSTVVGWSSFTQKSIWYARVGNIMFWMVRLDGVSDNSLTTFTLPYAAASDQPTMFTQARVTDLGVGALSPGSVRVTVSSGVLTCYRTLSNGLFSSTGQKAVICQGFYMLD